MTNRFSSAIRKTGGLACLLENDGNINDKSFAICVQPERTDGGDRTEIGSGHLHRFKFFAIANETTDLIREGSKLEFNGAKYLVHHIETAYAGSTAVYRRGTLIMAQEADA